MQLLHIVHRILEAIAVSYICIFLQPAFVRNLRRVEVRRAIPREEARQAQPRREREFNENTGRVFIGGLGDEVTDEVLKDFFSRFGELTSANVMVDRETNRPRGFGFVIYKNPDDAEKALGIHKDLGPNREWVGDLLTTLGRGLL
ncbi:heterogeneous nuclear ribonucleoprotein [Cyclospora cayetanensis]|uniref:Heterogeneous nuclear ribonucleoprotein n=1 Tax=Cyclospora cayetanensis TaxID=88456 RepID=A0A1D3CSP4_9EIME|nr:heterogeneous nuclear ribonucleoprotein [Cyclospora cayetanensis]